MLLASKVTEGFDMPRSTAVVATAPNSLRIEESDIAPLAPNDVLIRTHFSGVSTGTDKWVMQGQFTWIDHTFPLVPGYQRFGIVEEIGSQVKDFSVGQEVVATTSINSSSAFSAWGGHLSLSASPEDEVYDATGINPLRASLFISAQVGFNAASRLPEQNGAHVVVFGDGVIGTSGALAAKARGFNVLLVGRHEQRMSSLHQFGIQTISSIDCKERIRAFNPIAAIDTVQNDEAFNSYADALPMQSGLIVFSGHSPQGQKFWADMEYMQKRELQVAFVSGWTRERILKTLQLMKDGELQLEKVAQVSESTSNSILEIMNQVLGGSLKSVAAVLDWRKF